MVRRGHQILKIVAAGFVIVVMYLIYILFFSPIYPTFVGIKVYINDLNIRNERKTDLEVPGGATKIINSYLLSYAQISTTTTEERRYGDQYIYLNKNVTTSVKLDIRPWPRFVFPECGRPFGLSCQYVDANSITRIRLYDSDNTLIKEGNQINHDLSFNGTDKESYKIEVEYLNTIGHIMKKKFVNTDLNIHIFWVSREEYQRFKELGGQ